MATYKEIKGVTVQTPDSDPVQNAGSWASGPAINTARFQVPGAGATQNASYIVGGAIPPASPNRSALHEQFDGTSWTEAADLGTAKYAAGTFGTPSAALLTGGYDGSYTTSTENWNGSSWTAGTASNTTRGYMGASGTTTDGLIYGGIPGATGNTEKYNGSSWTETGDLNTARRSGGQSNLGSGSAAIFSGGNPPIMANVEQFNGSSWSETTDLNTARVHQWGMGTSTAQLVCGGDTPPRTTKTESWNGSAWTEVGDLVNASLANAGSGGGTATSAIIAAQYTGSLTTNSEQWDFPPVTAAILKEGMAFLSGGTSLKVFGTDVGVATATWASGANLSNARAMNAGIGSTNAALSLGGNAFGGPYPVTVEQYDGSSWTEVAEFNTGRAYLAGMGTITSGLICQGVDTAPPVFNTGKTEEWNGSSWTEKNDLGTARYRAGLVGYSATAGLCFGGFNLSEPYPPPASDFAGNESWDGTSWTEVNNLNTARGDVAGAGVQAAALAMGGYAPPSAPSKGVAVEEWNGSSWTEIAETSTNKRGRGGSGAVSRAIVFGGQTSPQNLTEMWNGSSWSEIADLSAGRYLAGSGSLGAVASFQSNGEEPGDSVKFEEFEADAALSTVTVS